MIAQLEIQAASINAVTFLKKSYCNTPFKIANITEDKKDPTLRLMLMSSSPGVLDADEYRIKIELDQHCSVQLHTQSYQRLFTMKDQAMQYTDVHLADNAGFCFIPHPVVPHKQSSFTSRNNFYLADNCSLIFGEILTCGRKLNGEVFSFSKYHSITRIFRNGKLLIKENLLMQPGLMNINAIGQLQGFTHQASLIYLEENAEIKTLIPQLYELLSSQEEISVGITAAPVNGLIVRILGQKAEQLFDCLKLVAGCLPQTNSLKPTAYAI
jgi:urease accessory protein